MFPYSISQPGHDGDRYTTLPATRAQNAVAAVFNRLRRQPPEAPAARALARSGCAGAPLESLPADVRLGRLPSWQPCSIPATTAPARPVPPDLLLVQAGARPLALLHGPENEVQGWLAWACQRGLAGLTSAIEFQPVADPRLGQYANLMGQRQPARAGSGLWRGLFVSPDPSWLVVAWLAEQRGWDATLGACLGYPVCCIDGFTRRWPKAVREYQGDPGLMLLAESESGQTIPWELNLFARYRGPSLTEHFPCSWHCQASIRRARWLSQVLSVTAPDREAAIRRHMQEPLTVAGRTLVFSGTSLPYPMAEHAS